MSKKWLATQPAILPRSDTSSPATKGGHPVSPYRGAAADDVTLITSPSPFGHKSSHGCRPSGEGGRPKCVRTG